MIFARSRPLAVGMIFATAALMLSAAGGDASAQSRRRVQEPPPAPEPLPEISGEAARCSLAFHKALSVVRDGNVRQLAMFESLARIVEPGAPGRWLYWAKTGKGAKPAAASEQVCLEFATRSGRQRCVRWETRRVEPALVSAQPTAEELTVLRALDSFVTDKGAPLEFGSNGRQFVTLQRVSGEIVGYSTQPPHPALCNGVPEMMDFHAGNLAGVRKRADDVASTAGKAATLARLRVNAAREQRIAEARSAAIEPPAPSGTDAAAPTRPATPHRPIPVLPSIAAGAGVAELVAAALEGLVPPEQLKSLEAESTVIRRLQKAREMVSPEALPDTSPATRAALGAALRMIEAAAYGELQVARVARFERLFLGTVEQIREAHRSHCTCQD